MVERITDYATRGGMTLQDAVRELVELGLQMEPTDALVLNARHRAYDDARRWAQTAFAAKLKELSLDAEEALGISIYGSITPKEHPLP